MTGTSTARLSIDEVLITERLASRRSRPPDYAGEAAAINTLMEHMFQSPKSVLQVLADKIIELTGACSSGISIAENDSGEPILRWHANGGEFRAYVGATMARYDSPCGTVLDTNAVQLMRVPEKHYPFAQQPHKPIEEVLLVPFYDGTTPVGTVWIITHQPDKHFDNEDMRLIMSLSRVAAAAVSNFHHIEQLEATTVSALEDAKRKTEFLSILSHELRNPLGPIVTAVSVLKHLISDASAIAMLDVVARQSNQLSKIVDDLLDVSRASVDKMHLRKTMSPLSKTVAIAIESSRESMHSKRHKFTHDSPDEELRILVDHVRIAQAIVNLLNNATRYTPEGGTISLTTARVGEQVLISVKDSGIGVNPEMMTSIFALFGQEGRRQDSGLGIGLTLVKRIAELHGGHVEAISPGEGLGSTFTIYLPWR